MAGLVPLPQTTHHHTTRLSHRQAHTILSTFLETAETNPAYRPDSTLSSHGVISSSTSANQNLTLNHLGRILKGIAGERVGGTSDFDEFFGYRDPRKRRRQDSQTDADTANEGGLSSQGQEYSADGRVSKKKRQDVEEVQDLNGDEGFGNVDPVAQKIVEEDIDDWQDKEDYEHAQVEETREVLLDDEDPTRMVEDGTNEVLPEDVEIDAEAESSARYRTVARSEQQAQRAAPIDKKARKLAKKGKRLEERRARHQAMA